MEILPVERPVSPASSSFMERVRTEIRSDKVKGLLAAAVAVVALTGFSSAESAGTNADTTTNSVPEHPLFGAHIPGIGSGEFPDEPIQAVRLWDSGVSWRELEPKQDKWDFSTLDTAVETAEKHDAQITLVLGQTPQWAAKYPNQANIYVRGASSPVEDLTDWDNYVKKVVKRYKGRIGSYEVWNEINLDAFYAGSDGHMVRLTRETHDILQQIDPGAKLLSPSVLLRAGGPRTAMDDFIEAGGLQYVDAISVHGYPKPDGTPEDGAAMMRAFRGSLPDAYKDLPIWDTEINYGLPWGGIGESPRLTPEEQAGYVIRTLFLQADAGANRVYLYNWSGAPFLGVKMIDPVTGALKPPAQAYATAVKWLKNGDFQGCEVGDYGGRTCYIDYDNGDRGIIKWHPKDEIKVTLPDNTVALYDTFGNKLNYSKNESLFVGDDPILIRID